MKYTLSTVVTLIISYSLISCSDDPSSIGLNLLQQDFVVVSTYDTRDNPITQSSSFYKKVVPLGLSSQILIGKKDDFEASTLMNFIFVIDDSLEQDFLNDIIMINHAYIELIPKYTYTDEAASMDFSVYKITSDWSISGFTSDSLVNLTYDNVDLSSNKNFTDSIYTFDIDNDFIDSWIKSVIDTSLGKNKGIYYKPDINSDKIVGFQALTLSTSESAKLKVVIEKPGSFIDTLSAFLIGDVSVVTGDTPDIPEGDIEIQASITVQSRLFFDINELPNDIAINNAEIILTEDVPYSIKGSTYNSNLSLYKITDSSTITIDEINQVVLTKSDSIYTGNITGLLISWLKNKDNQGVVIRATSLTEGLELYAIKGSDNPVITDRPRLRINFTGREN